MIMFTAHTNYSFSLVLATTEAVAEKTQQIGMRVLVPRLFFEEKVNK